MSESFAEAAKRLRRLAAGVDAERDRLDRLIERHRRRREGLRRPCARDVIDAVMPAVTEAAGGSAYEVSGPYGLGGEHYVTVTDGLSSHVIVVRTGDGPEVRLVDVGSDNDRYPENSIGRMNGFHRNAGPMPGVDELARLFRDGMAEDRLRRMAGG